jgi:hypothetical protein
MSSAFAAEDWAYELSSKAREIYAQKKTQIPCEKIPELLKRNNTQDIYIAIRDAGLFQTKSCGVIIQKHANALNQLPGVKDAIAFYFFKQGDKQQLNILADDFDKEARSMGDHWTVDLFGFMDDWNISGVRLVRHAAYSDAVGAELLCSALMWRRYLFGEKSFSENWYKVGKQEQVVQRKLDNLYETCGVKP